MPNVSLSAIYRMQVEKLSSFSPPTYRTMNLPAGEVRLLNFMILHTHNLLYGRMNPSRRISVPSSECRMERSTGEDGLWR